MLPCACSVYTSASALIVALLVGYDEVGWIMGWGLVLTTQISMLLDSHEGIGSGG